MSGYDIIGDVHGEDVKMIGLLKRLGYVNAKGVYRAAVGLLDWMSRRVGADPLRCNSVLQ